eukprot:2558809-Amphidinium_carterae.1
MSLHKGRWLQVEWKTRVAEGILPPPRPSDSHWLSHAEMVTNNLEGMQKLMAGRVACPWVLALQDALMD